MSPFQQGKKQKENTNHSPPLSISTCVMSYDAAYKVHTCAHFIVNCGAAAGVCAACRNTPANITFTAFPPFALSVHKTYFPPTVLEKFFLNN